MTRITVPAVTATARVMRNPVTRYSQDFDAGLDGWANLGAGGTPLGPTYSARGSSGYHSAFGGATQTGTKTVAGLTVGRTYSLLALTGSERVAGGTLTGKVGINGIGASAAVALPAMSRTQRQLAQVRYDFVATAVSHQLQLITISSAGVTSSLSRWDAVRLIEHESQIGADLPLNLRRGSWIELDDRRAPFAQASLRIALPSDADLAKLDTRSSTSRVRVIVVAEQEIVSPAAPDESRTFDLLLHERDGDYSPDGTSITLVCHSDEAITIDAGNETATVDLTPSYDAQSLRAMVSTMLQKRGMFLEAGAADADYTITTELLQLITNPGGEVAATGYISANGGATIARNTAQHYVGVACITATATASGIWGIAPVPVSGAPTLPVTEGKQYWASVKVAMSVARDATISIRWFNAANVQIGADDTSPATTIGTIGTAGWQTLQWSSTAPALAVKASIFVLAAAGAIGNIIYTDAWSFVQFDGNFDPGPFDGATPADAYYSYSWTAVANASTSKRSRLDTRDPLLLNQDPGETDWDFLQPLVQTAALRLFCDELRRWYLVDPATYTAPGSLELDNPQRGEDRISRDRGDWADAIVVEYTWTDAAGIQQVKRDVASAGGTLLQLIKWNRPYPGSGAAAAILARYQGRGRLQTITASADLTATPAMAVATELPSTPAQEGFVSRVRYDLDAASIAMTITPRELEDA